MVSIKKIILIVACVLIGVFLAFIVNMYVVEKILIPDPCYYHNNGTNKYFDIFYELTSVQGYHPFPTKFNFILTGVIGTISGIAYARYKITKKSK